MSTTKAKTSNINSDKRRRDNTLGAHGPAGQQALLRLLRRSCCVVPLCRHITGVARMRLVVLAVLLSSRRGWSFQVLYGTAARPLVAAQHY